jgi:Ca2+-binding RTX toxin-like protein
MAEIRGANGNDLLPGAAEPDKIWGYGGDDRLWGGSRNDDLNGGEGRDTLFGGLGADTFSYSSVNDSPKGGRIDVILDFDPLAGDKIDLSGVDANANWYSFGNQAFGLSQLSYNRAGGILTAQVFGGPDVQVQLSPPPNLNLTWDVVL